MALQESGEMYLESILLLSRKNGAVRSVDISEHMGYSKPSVSRAVGLLRSGGYIIVEDDGHITLTSSGREMAEKILARHTLLTRLLEHLGVDPETASTDACKMEHVISDTTFAAIREFVSRNQKQTEL